MRVFGAIRAGFPSGRRKFHEDERRGERITLNITKCINFMATSARRVRKLRTWKPNVFRADANRTPGPPSEQ